MPAVIRPPIYATILKLWKRTSNSFQKTSGATAPRTADGDLLKPQEWRVLIVMGVRETEFNGLCIKFASTKERSHIVRMLFIKWYTKYYATVLETGFHFFPFLFLETRVPSRAAALGIIIIILWVNIFYTESTPIIKWHCIGFSVVYLVVRARKWLTLCADCYAFSICRGAVIGLARLNSVKKLRGNDPCHSDIGTAPRRQNVCWRGAWIYLNSVAANGTGQKRLALFLY